MERLKAVGRGWLEALPVWWAFFWRMIVALAAATAALSLAGVALVSLGMSAETWRAVVAVAVWPLTILVQLEAFRRLIRLYGIRTGVSDGQAAR